MDEATQVKDWQLSGIGSQFDSGTHIRKDTAADTIEVNRIKKVQQQLSEGKDVTSESGQTLVRIFCNQFDDTFA